MRISITQTRTGLEVHLQGDRQHFEAALDTLKQEVPRQGRRFDAVRRCWIISAGCSRQLERWARRMRSEMGANVVSGGQARDFSHGPGHQTTDAYAVLHLLPTAPPELIKAAYRCLAMIHHPDRGGDTEAMQRINSAYAGLSAKLARA